MFARNVPSSFARFAASKWTESTHPAPVQIKTEQHFDSGRNCAFSLNTIPYFLRSIPFCAYFFASSLWHEVSLAGGGGYTIWFSGTAIFPSTVCLHTWNVYTFERRTSEWVVYSIDRHTSPGYTRTRTRTWTERWRKMKRAWKGISSERHTFCCLNADRSKRGGSVECKQTKYVCIDMCACAVCMCCVPGGVWMNRRLRDIHITNHDFICWFIWFGSVCAVCVVRFSCGKTISVQVYPEGSTGRRPKQICIFNCLRVPGSLEISRMELEDTLNCKWQNLHFQIHLMARRT